MANAKEKLNEQDDEIKQINEYILNAKCHAIRDAQLQEKWEIEKVEKEEEVCIVWAIVISHYFVTIATS